MPVATETTDVENADPALAGVATERLEHEAASLAASLAAATCRFVLLVAELDRREAWKAWGCKSMADWCSWRCGIGLVTAREHVRVGPALADLPAIRDALAAGTLSYSKARALTRVATPGSESELLGLATHASASQLDHIVRAYARVRAAEDPDTTRTNLERRGLWIRHHDDGTATITARVPADVADLVETALGAAAAGTLPHDAKTTEPDPERSPDPRATALGARRRADALETLARTYLQPDPHRAATTTVTVEIRLDDLDPEPTTEPPTDVEELLAHPALPRPVLERYLCDPGLRRMLTANGVPVNLGRTVRRVTPAQRAALNRRDRRCRFRGCAATQHLHAHHLHHWIHGGTTDLDNLFLVCPYHHRLLHDGGWTVTGTAPSGLAFHAPHGPTITQDAPPHPAAQPLPAASAPTPARRDRLDLDLTITGLVALLPPPARN